MNRMFIAVLVSCTVSSSAAFAQSNIMASVLASAVKAAADRTNLAKPATGTTKVAVINIGVIFTKYERAAASKQEMQEEVKKLQVEAKQLTKDLTFWQAALQKGELSAAKKEQYEENVINARRRLEDLGREARTKLGKTQEAGLLVLWKDVREAVKIYSKTHGIELVIAYGDPKDSDMVDTMPNISRKMQSMDAGAGVPFFTAPGVDISEAIVDLLNKQYREKKAEPAEEQER